MAQMVEDKIATDLAATIPLNWHRANEPRLSLSKGFTSGIIESQALYDLVRDQLINHMP